MVGKLDRAEKNTELRKADAAPIPKRSDVDGPPRAVDNVRTFLDTFASNESRRKAVPFRIFPPQIGKVTVDNYSLLLFYVSGASATRVTRARTATNTTILAARIPVKTVDCARKSDDTTSSATAPQVKKML